MFKRFFVMGFLRAWVGFVVVAILAGVAFMGMDGDNPLRSDDPYVFGFVCGGFAAAMGVVYTFVQELTSSPRRAAISYFAITGLWFAFLVISASFSVEGSGVIVFIAEAHFLSGTISWFLFRFRLSVIFLTVVSLAGLTVLTMYRVVLMRMGVLY